MSEQFGEKHMMQKHLVAYFWCNELCTVFPVIAYITHTHNRFTALLEFVRTTCVSGYQKGKNKEGKTNLDLLEQEIVSGCGICWDRSKSAPHPR